MFLTLFHFVSLFRWGGSGETGVVKLIAIPNKNKKTRVLVLREDRVESWLFHLPSKIEEVFFVLFFVLFLRNPTSKQNKTTKPNQPNLSFQNTTTFEWDVQLSSLLGGPTTWLDMCRANNNTIVLLAEKEGGLFLVPLCLSGEGLVGEGGGGGEGAYGKGAMEVPGGGGRRGECRLLGVHGFVFNFVFILLIIVFFFSSISHFSFPLSSSHPSSSKETVSVCWNDACLLAHITPKPTDGQEAPIKDHLTFSRTIFHPPG